MVVVSVEHYNREFNGIRALNKITSKKALSDGLFAKLRPLYNSIMEKYLL
jgi:hypothetical protein